MTMRKIRICIQPNCQNAQTTQDYCRLHYLKNWKIIKRRERQQQSKRLNRYVEGIMKRNLEEGSGRPGQRHTEEPIDDATVSSLSSTEEVENLIEDLGYDDPQSLDQLIENLKVNKDY